MREQESHLDLRLFLMSDAVTAGYAVKNQPKAGQYSATWKF